MSDFPCTSLDEIETIHTTLVESFKAGKAKSIHYRKQQLLNLAYLVKENADRFYDAWKKDLVRPDLESRLFEIDGTIGQIMANFNSVDKWSKPEKPSFDPKSAAMWPVVRKEPKGVVLIISPSNYTLGLALDPAAGAIAAGNAVVIKPSELTPNVSALMAELFPKYMDQDLFRIVNGGVTETTKLLELKWDHILYTGNGRVARIILSAAAKHLTPVSTELGGKCPVIIDPDCDLKTAAKRILWGKFLNSGQTCVAPDYILVPKHFQDTLVAALLEAYHEFYPTPLTPQSSYDASFSHVVSTSHARRIKGLLDDTRGKVVVGGEIDVDERWIAPTIVQDCGGEDALMSEEIFGPVLPVVPVNDLDEAIDFVNARDHPLALYLFTRNKSVKTKVFDNTQSGAAVANDCIMHFGVSGLPFGGIGPSGNGHHTGKYSFDMFTHLRASIDSPSWLDWLMSARYPPYTPEKSALLHKLASSALPPRDSLEKSWWNSNRLLLFTCAALGIAAATNRTKPNLLTGLISLGGKAI